MITIKDINFKNKIIIFNNGNQEDGVLISLIDDQICIKGGYGVKISYPYSKFKKLNFEGKKAFLSYLINFIMGALSDSPDRIQFYIHINETYYNNFLERIISDFDQQINSSKRDLFFMPTGMANTKTQVVMHCVEPSSALSIDLVLEKHSEEKEYCVLNYSSGQLMAKYETVITKQHLEGKDANSMLNSLSDIVKNGFEKFLSNINIKFDTSDSNAHYTEFLARSLFLITGIHIM